MSGRSRGWIVLRSLLGEAYASLRARRMQALLSSFGIAIGIAAVVLLVALVSGVHRMALSSLNAAGGNLVQVTVEPDPATGRPDGFPFTLRASDIDLILSSSDRFDLAYAYSTASPIVQGRVVEVTVASLNPVTGGEQIGSMSRPRQATVRGITAAGFEMQALEVAEGRLPLPVEQREGARVAVLGAHLAGELFGSASPVGDFLVLGDWPYRVIGVLDWVGQPTGEFRMPQDRYVYVPFRASSATFRGNDSANAVYLRLREPDRKDEAVAEARSIIAARQRLHGESSGILDFRTPIERLSELNLVINALKLLAGFVGGIGLFVGAVGVANVLLVSVRERTQEIGVRRAVGATRHDIFVGFLVEAMAITLAGGLVGVLLAWLLTLVVGLIPAIPDGAEPHVSLATAFVAVSILVIVGLAAGVGPARRAAGIFPAEALRAE